MYVVSLFKTSIMKKLNKFLKIFLFGAMMAISCFSIGQSQDSSSTSKGNIAPVGGTTDSTNISGISNSYNSANPTNYSGKWGWLGLLGLLGLTGLGKARKERT